MKIPDEKIQEIREASDIVETISQYVTLKKRGKGFFGLCPFHAEKTPSFHVDPIKGFYHCFGCHAGGNVITFVMEMEKISFPEALRQLAKKANITLPRYIDDQMTKDTEILYQANRFAMEFFQQSLNSTASGEKALYYFLNRGFTKDSVKTFSVGFAPDTWNGLIQAAQTKSFPIKHLLAAGLIIPSKTREGHYDRFRGRLMFPIFNSSGHVVGFGGRNLKKDEKTPKYINSPETEVYQKSRILYGIHQSKTGIRREDRLLLVEGYTDVIQLFQNGLDYCAATSGTALTSEQAHLITRYTKNVTLVFDGDSAGLQASLRGLDILLKAGLHVHIALLPDGQDPDSFLQKHGAQAMAHQLSRSQSVVDFYLSQLSHKRDLDDPTEKTKTIRELFEIVDKILDPLEKQLMFQHISEKLNVDESLLARFKKKQPSQKTASQDSTGKVHSASQEAELGLLRLLLEDGRKWGKPIFRFVEPDLFTDSRIKSLIKSLYDEYLLGHISTAEELLDKYSQDVSMSRFLSGLLSEELKGDIEHARYALDCILILTEDRFHRQINDIREKMRTAQENGRDGSVLSQAWMDLQERSKRKAKQIREAWKKDVEI